MIIFGVCREIFHFFKSKSTWGSNFRMTFICQFIFPFRYEHINFIFGQIPNKTFNITCPILMVLSIIMCCTDFYIRPVQNFHSRNKQLGPILFNKLQKSLYSIKQTVLIFSQYRQSVLFRTKAISLIFY